MSGFSSVGTPEGETSLAETHLYTWGVKLSWSFLHSSRTGWRLEVGGWGGGWGGDGKMRKRSAMWKQMSGIQSSLSLAGLKGCINIWVRCKKQRFSVAASTLLWSGEGGLGWGGFNHHHSEAPRWQKTKWLQTLPPSLPPLGSQHFQTCHSADLWTQMNEGLWVETEAARRQSRGVRSHVGGSQRSRLENYR